MNLSLRMPTLRLLSLAILLGVATNAIAQLQPIERRMTPEQFDAAGLNKLSAAELANLNVWLDRERTTAAAGETHEERSDRPTTERPRDSFVGASDEPVRSRLRGAVQEWAPGAVFELENGQRWRVIKGRMTLNQPLQAPEIEVAPGLMGRWFLQVDEDAPRARVERIE